MSILTKLLQKKGLDSVDELSSDEKRDYDRWHRILSVEPITVEKIVEFCKTQKGFVESQLANLDNSTQKNERLIIINNVYGKLISLIESPQSEKEALEKYLNNLIIDKK